VLVLSCLSFASGGTIKGTVPSNYLYEGKEENTAVVEYKEGVDFTSSTAPKLVVFYSPYCGHCTHFAPTYMKFAKDITEKYPQAEFYAVSCKAHRDVCAQYTIAGYPTVHAFLAGSDTSFILKARNSEAAIIEALKLDEIVEEEAVAVDRKLDLAVDEEEGGDAAEEDEEEGGHAADEDEEEEDGDAADEDEEEEGGDAADEDEEEEEGDAADEDEEEEDGDSADEDGSGNARLRAGGRLSNAAKDSDASEAQSQGDTVNEDATGTEDENEVGGSQEGADTDGAADSDGDTELAPPGDEEETNASGEEDSNASEEEPDSIVDMLNMNKMAPPVGMDEDDESADTEEEMADVGDKDSDAEQNSEEDDEEQTDGAEDETGNTEEETESDGAYLDAPRGGKDISEAVEAYREENKNGIRPGAGAQKGKTQNRDMDKWKELIAKKKEEFTKRRFGRGKKDKKGKIGGQTNTEGETNVMKANTPGTVEYKDRIQKLLKKINKLRKKRGLPPISSPVVVTKKSQMPLKKEVKKPGFVRKQGEKIPIVKRAFQMTEEEQLILDASLSFMAGLKYGVFMSNDSLTAKQKAALKSWLDLMSVSLPPEWGLHSLIDELNENIDMISQSHEKLLTILRKHPLPRHEWSPSCMRRDSPQGFSCGMWKLLHTSTLGIAEQRGGLNLVQSGAVDPGTRIFSPADAADTIREYLAHFFGCIECRNHFIAQYDECSFRRCDRLTDDATVATAEDWKQLALWLWEVHNDVSIRVAHERIDRAMEDKKATRHRMARLKREDEIKHLYPSLEQCFPCFYENGGFDEDNVFEFLEATYWSAPDVTADKLLQYRGEEGSASSFFWFFVIMVLAAIYMLRGRKADTLQRTVNAAMVKGRQMGGKKRYA